MSTKPLTHIMAAANWAQRVGTKKGQTPRKVRRLPEVVEVIINVTYGGFRISRKAFRLYNERCSSHKRLRSEYCDERRDDPLLVAIVKELGEEACGGFLISKEAVGRYNERCPDGQQHLKSSILCRYDDKREDPLLQQILHELGPGHSQCTSQFEIHRGLKNLYSFHEYDGQESFFRPGFPEVPTSVIRTTVYDKLLPDQEKVERLREEFVYMDCVKQLADSLHETLVFSTRKQ